MNYKLFKNIHIFGSHGIARRKRCRTKVRNRHNSLGEDLKNTGSISDDEIEQYVRKKV